MKVQKKSKRFKVRNKHKIQNEKKNCLSQNDLPNVVLQIPNTTEYQTPSKIASQIAKRNSILSISMFNVQCSLIFCSTQFMF